MATRKRTKPPVDYPEALVALIERWQTKHPLAVEMLDTLAAEPSLQDWLVPEGTITDQDAWTGEFKAFYGWAATDLTAPMPSVAHLILAKHGATKADFAKTPKGARQKGRRRTSASVEQIDAYLDDLLAIPEHQNCGWTFALRLLRILGSGSDYRVFRERYDRARERLAEKTQTPPEPPKRRRTTKASAA